MRPKTSKQKAQIVRKGYTKIAEKYHNQRSIYPNKKLLLKFIKYLPKNSRVLDLGCGAGVPVSKFLADNRYKVTGIDFSDGMLRLARKNVPKAKFLKMDMTKLRLKENSFDGAVSFYAIIHVPREKHSRIYRGIHKILKNNAIILANAGGNKEWEEIANDYMGVPMFWSFYSPKRTLSIIKNAGFDVIWNRILKLGGETQFWVMARNQK